MFSVKANTECSAFHYHIHCSFEDVMGDFLFEESSRRSNANPISFQYRTIHKEVCCV